jgi:hypothetical protein
VSNETHISLADLEAAGLRLPAFEAATIAREVANQVLRGELPGVPSLNVIRLAPDGRVTVEGPVEAGGRAVPRAAQLLDALLPGFDAPPALRVPGALRLVVARALRTLDLPAYPSLESFVDALARFSAPESGPVVRDLVAAWAEAIHSRSDAASASASEQAPAVSAAPLAHMLPAATALTISDIRRARRATGLTLSDIAERSRIPAWLLRELEWGYYRNWPAGQAGRTQLIRYAHAAGLDDQVVVRTIWPQAEGEARPDGRAVVPAMEWNEGPEWHDTRAAVLVPSGIGAAEDIELRPLAAPDSTAHHGSRRRAMALLAIPALLVIGVLPAILQQRSAPEAPAIVERQEARGEAPVPVSPVPQERAADPVDPEPAPPSSAEAEAPAAEAPAAATPEAPTSRPVNGLEPADRPARALAESPAYSPAFSAVGTAMFYHTSADGQSALMRADADSQGAVLRVTSVVDDEARNYHPRPSPDGTQIAFDSDREGERAVYIADADGQKVRRVSEEGFAAIPSWSPDGRTLAYVRAEPGRPRVWNIWLTDLATGESRRLTSHRVGQPWGASWFPDGRRIAYSHETRLVIHDLDTGAERAHQSPIKGRLVRTPAVSPDGARIMFQVHRDGAWLMNVADGSMRKVLSDPTAEEYTWSPDGRRVAYHSRESGAWGVWIMGSR